MKRPLALATVLAALLPLSANAHKQWLQPSATVVAGNDPWISVDAAVSNNLFYFDHVAMRTDNIVVTAPDGSNVPLQNAHTGKLRSVFDIELNKPGTWLSGGQQQRLCIARGVAVKPQVLLLDEPTSALDPISTMRIEDLIHELKREFTIAIVTHNMQQAARVSDYTAYMYLGELIEFGKTDELFIKPQDKRTEDYITGRVG